LKFEAGFFERPAAHRATTGQFNLRYLFLYNLSINSSDTTKTSAAAPGLFVALLLFFLCLTRPSLFGQDFNYIGGIGIVFTTLAFLLTRSGAGVVIGRSSPQLNITVALLAFWSYAFGLTIFFGNANLPFLFKASAAGFSVPVCFLLLASNSDLVDRTFAVFARINSGLGYSIGITFCLLPIVGYSSLRFFTYAIGGYEDADSGSGNGDILLPFSVVYGNLIEYGIYRFCAIYREAGIAQAFFVWSFIYLMYSRAKLIWIIGPLLGALLCGSTAVVFSLGAAALVHFGSRSMQRPRELLILVVMLAVLGLLLVFAPGLGLEDKAVTHGSSLSDREEAMAMALPSGDNWRWLFGHGLFYESTKKVENVGINAISAIFHIGVIGFALYMATFFAGLFGTRSYRDACRYLTLISPFLVTSLFFQPVIDAPLVLAVLFAFPPTVAKS
jgi:hypothetical protein